MMVGYVLHETGRNSEYQYYNDPIPVIFLNKEKARTVLMSHKMTLKLFFVILESPKYKDENFSHTKLIISQMIEDLYALLSNEEMRIDKPKFIGNSSNKDDQNNHLLKVNEWKNSPFALRRDYLSQYQDVVEFYNNGGRFDWLLMINIITSEHKRDMEFHIEEYEIVE